ncbi:MAG: EamA family transporter [Phycisphaeraceae bacterium]|nr:EamA family transporter [Phycisphaeraceae bacterium]MCW5754458.1 EamA family transporter [Phycisphaeraceae bacterium]
MKAILLALGAGVCWGVGEVFTRSVLHSGKVGPITAITIRTTVALPVLWAAYFLAMHVWGSEPRGWWRAEPAILLKLVLGSGLVAGAAAMIFFYASLKFGEVSTVKPIAFATAPALAVLLGWLALGERMTAHKAIGVLLILAGVIVLTGGSHAPKPVEPMIRSS